MSLFDKIEDVTIACQTSCVKSCSGPAWKCNASKYTKASSGESASKARNYAEWDKKNYTL